MLLKLRWKTCETRVKMGNPKEGQNKPENGSERIENAGVTHCTLLVETHHSFISIISQFHYFVVIFFALHYHFEVDLVHFVHFEGAIMHNINT